MKNITVFYIDDEISLCEIFFKLFNRDGVTVKFFSDHKIAIDEIASSIPDLLFIDYRLNGITGEEVALKLNTSIPKVLITGELDLPCPPNFLKVLPKPTKPTDIQEIIDLYR